MASDWYRAYGSAYRPGLLDPVVWDNPGALRVRRPRLDLTLTPIPSYFAATYVGNGSDRLVRSAINASVRKAVAALPGVRNRPDPRKVAVVSGSWSPGHSAYRITRAFVEALKATT